MSEAGDAEAGQATAMRRRLKWLMAARLGLSLGVFALVLVFLGVGREGAATVERGLYGTVAAAFGATLLYATLFPWVRRLGRFGVLQLATDVAVVTSLVCWSGGADSFFGFLYLPITLFGAMLFDRRGAYGSAVLCSAGYALALAAAERWNVREAFGGYAPGASLSALWMVHTSALLLVALLSSALMREVRMAGAALQESTTDLDRLRRLHERTVESLTSGLLTTDASGHVTSFNPEAERITGRREAEVLGARIESVLPGIEGLVLGGPEESASARLRLRLDYRRGDGDARHLGLSGSVLRDAQGGADGHVVIFQDVTDVVAMEHDLRRSERLAVAGQLAADMAHEIRNPLAAISGSIEMLRDGLSGSAVDAEHLRLMEIVLREVERLDRLIADFLAYARPAPAQPAAVDLGPVLDELTGMFEASPASEGVETRVAVPPGTGVRVDPRQLRQLLWNLVLNAAQAMPEGGRLEIAARGLDEPPQGAPSADRNGAEKEPVGVEISISDTGVGIPPDVLERIFDPFFTTKRGGTGLGLATVHRVVEGNGGSVRAESRVGEGTCFRIRLPAAEVTE